MRVYEQQGSDGFYRDNFSGRVFHDPGLQEKVAEMRHPLLQASSGAFRRNAQYVGRQLAAAVREQEQWYRSPEKVTNSGGTARYLPTDNPVMLCILRAGLPMTLGALEIFEESPVAFVDAKRIEGTYDAERGDIKVRINYQAFPKTVETLADRNLLVPETMLATGHSMVEVWQHVVGEYGLPKRTIALAAIAAIPGIEYVLEHIPGSKIYVAVVDDGLDDRGFIVPGLGDAGDLCFNGGKKLLR
ncbi:MAG TPA: uracil phosphoribosyltransferase [Candidatus Nanoarchaeia archaeon]|nr:uracil phosphoribosyltransferase [Candidatus Nanoarchaeia archaeon]